MIRSSNAKTTSALKKASPVDTDQVDILEKRNVQQAYQQIAHHFDATRSRPWPVVSDFLGRFKFSLILDNGCGNGRHLIGLNQIGYGIDFCIPFCFLAARNTRAEIFCADAMHLPFAADTFDGIISIAVIHHFASRDHRLAAIAEIGRVLQPGGKALICVWALQDGVPQDAYVPWTQQIKNPVHCSDLPGDESFVAQQSDQPQNYQHTFTNYPEKSCQVFQYHNSHDPKTSNGFDKKQNSESGPGCITSDIQGPTGQTIVQTQRYYHFFSDIELAELVREAGLQIDKQSGQCIWEAVYGKSCEQRDCYLDCGNWYCVLTK